MLGYCGRHASINTENTTNLRACQNVLNEYKKLQQLPQQTICKNNMTQEKFEQHFHDFKHTYFKAQLLCAFGSLTVEAIHKEVLFY